MDDLHSPGAPVDDCKSSGFRFRVLPAYKENRRNLNEYFEFVKKPNVHKPVSLNNMDNDDTLCPIIDDVLTETTSNNMERRQKNQPLFSKGPSLTNQEGGNGKLERAIFYPKELLTSTESFLFIPMDREKTVEVARNELFKENKEEKKVSTKKTRKFLRYFKDTKPNKNDSGHGTSSFDTKDSIKGLTTGNDSLYEKVEYTWYQPHFTREEAIAKLMGDRVGEFLVRKSTSVEGAFALSVKIDATHIGHYLIVHNSDGGFSFEGMDANWPDLPQLVKKVKILSQISS